MAERQNGNYRRQTNSQSVRPRQRTASSDQRKREVERRRAYAKNEAKQKKARATRHASVNMSTTKAISKAESPIDVLSAIISNKPLFIGILLVLVLGIGWVIDLGTNWDKAYGGVHVGGVDVSGLNAEQMRSKLSETLGKSIDRSEVMIYASEEAKAKSQDETARLEAEALAEELSEEEADRAQLSWKVTKDVIHADLAYDYLIDKALAQGRGDGGFFGRLNLLVGTVDIPAYIELDWGLLEDIGEGIDSAIGSERVDTTVEIDDGMATVVEGKTGVMVDRGWLAKSISDIMVSSNPVGEFIAVATPAPSRISLNQAQEAADAINRAIGPGVKFEYGRHTWEADRYDVGNWVTVRIEPDGDGHKLVLGVDRDEATEDVINHVNAEVTTDNVIIDFEVNGSDVKVHTSGSGLIPDVPTAMSSLSEGLFGDDGRAWVSEKLEPLNIEIVDSNAPETLSLDQARDLGIVTVIGEYTTSFSNYEGTENRNHNIKLAADILNNTIAESNGGEWSFNDHSGDTNQDPPFASAGSIINGEYVDSIGGGICQVATTVFNAVFESGLDVSRRWNHTLYIASYPNGRDASVSYPDMDLKWVNTQPSDVLLQMSHTDDSVTAKLLGVSTGYTVEAEEGAWEEGEKYETEFEEDSSLGEGEYYLKTKGEDGRSISVTRTVKDRNGEVVSVTVFPSDYHPKDEVYVIGPGVDKKKLERDEDEKKDNE